MNLIKTTLKLGIAGALALACASDPPPPPSQAETEKTRQDHDQAQQQMDQKQEEKKQREEANKPQSSLAGRAEGFELAAFWQKPGWFENPYAKHSQDQYLAAAGQGPSKSAAEGDAQGNIAKIFMAKIKAETNMVQKYFQNSKGSAKSMSMEKRNQVGTDKVISGMKIVNGATGGGTFYALAVLEKGPAAERIKSAIEKLDGEIAAKMKAGDGASDKVKAFKSYGAAMEKLEERTVLNADLQVLEGGKGMPLPVSWEDVNSKFEAAQENLKVGIEVSAKVNVGNLEGSAKAEAQRIESCIKEKLGNLGLQFQDDDDDLDMKVVANAQFQPVQDRSPDEKMVNVNIDFQIINVKKNNKVLTTWTEALGKVARPNWVGSVQTAANKICAQSAPQIKAKVKKFMSK